MYRMWHSRGQFPDSHRNTTGQINHTEVNVKYLCYTYVLLLKLMTIQESLGYDIMHLVFL